MIALELYTHFPSSDNVMDLNEPSIDNYGLYTDSRTYYYDMRASPLQMSHTESRHTWSIDGNTTPEETIEVTPSTLR
ncbi:unnamed protein product [Penicillium nalgiovense]|nr:unnamed protein product [Penicillium nalgiovense]